VSIINPLTCTTTIKRSNLASSRIFSVIKYFHLVGCINVYAIFFFLCWSVGLLVSAHFGSLSVQILILLLSQLVKHCIKCVSVSNFYSSHHQTTLCYICICSLYRVGRQWEWGWVKICKVQLQTWSNTTEPW